MRFAAESLPAPASLIARTRTEYKPFFRPKILMPPEYVVTTCVITFPPRVKRTSYDVARIFVGGVHRTIAVLRERAVRTEVGAPGTLLSSVRPARLIAVYPPVFLTGIMTFEGAENGLTPPALIAAIVK